MNSFLMYRDKDFNLEQELCSNAEILISDLELDTIFEAFSASDEYIKNVAKVAMLTNLKSIEDIRYRQEILKDTINNFEIINEIYQINNEAIEKEKSIFFAFFRKYPDVILHSSIKRIDISVKYLKRIKDILKLSSHSFKSDGFKNFINMLENELSDEYIKKLEIYLKDLRLREGVVVYFELKVGVKPKKYILYKEKKQNINWMQKLFRKRDKNFRFCIDSRDESGSRIISELKNQGINGVANTLALTADHLKNFLNILKSELAFYAGCANLHKYLTSLNINMTFPMPYESNKRVENFEALQDISLILIKKSSVVENSLKADKKDLFIITGANKGGKTSYLRSVAIANLMMQSGMFVTAKKFDCNISENFFTHFKKDEDNSLKSGKFDEELKRMSEIVENITPNSLMIFNESFAATNESEGSLIATDIVNAFLDKNIKIFFITHMYSFAEKFLKKGSKSTIFLRAGRDETGKRSYKIKEGVPLKTSFGEDIYKKIFTF